VNNREGNGSCRGWDTPSAGDLPATEKRGTKSEGERKNDLLGSKAPRDRWPRAEQRLPLNGKEMTPVREKIPPHDFVITLGQKKKNMNSGGGRGYLGEGP